MMPVGRGNRPKARGLWVTGIAVRMSAKDYVTLLVNIKNLEVPPIQPGSVAISVERWTEEQEIVGSNPNAATTFVQCLSIIDLIFSFSKLFFIISSR